MLIISWIHNNPEMTMLLQKLFFILLSASYLHQHATAIHKQEVTKEITAAIATPVNSDYDRNIHTKEIIEDIDWNESEGIRGGILVEDSSQPDNNDLLTESIDFQSQPESFNERDSTTTSNLFPYSRSGRHERIAPNLPLLQEDSTNLYQINESKVIFANILQYTKTAIRINPTLQPFYYLFQLLNKNDGYGNFSINFIIGTFIIDIIHDDQQSNGIDWFDPDHHFKPIDDDDHYDIYFPN